MAVEPVEEKTIRLAGPITLYEVAAVRQTLRAALVEGRPLRIDLKDSGPWDLAGLQLLIACVRSGQNTDQSVRLVNIPRGFTDLAERSGLSQWLQSVSGP
jgi:ABC-type transporter Mla MlaB component